MSQSFGGAHREGPPPNGVAHAERDPRLHIWFQPPNGEALAIRSTDYESLEAAVAAVNDALQRGRVLRFELGGRVGDSGVALVNFANVVAVKVRPEPVEGAADGQYL